MSSDLITNNQNHSVSNYIVDDNKIRTLRKALMPKTSTDADLELFIEYCRRTQLDPFARQIYAIDVGGKLSIQTSIDGFRVIAQRTGEYRGQEVYWCGSDGIWKDVWLDEKKPPSASKVLVYRQGYDKPISGIALFKEYNRKINGKYTMWDKMPAVMLAKCAESLALRKAFPNELSGIYTSDEMEQANNNKPSKNNNKNNVADITADTSQSIDNSIYDEKTDTYINNDIDYSIVPPSSMNAGKKWLELTIDNLIKALDYYKNKKPNENYLNAVNEALNEQLSICPIGLSKGLKWIELSTDKLETYYKNYKDGKLIGFADEYSAYIENILLERKANQSNTEKTSDNTKKSQAIDVKVNEDEDPFSTANDGDWDDMLEEQEANENNPPNQVKDSFDDEDKAFFNQDK